MTIQTYVAYGYVEIGMLKNTKETWGNFFIKTYSALSYKCYVLWYFRSRSSVGVGSGGKTVIFTPWKFGLKTPNIFKKWSQKL